MRYALLALALACACRDTAAPRGTRFSPPLEILQQVAECSELAMPTPTHMPAWYSVEGDYLTVPSNGTTADAFGAAWVTRNYIEVVSSTIEYLNGKPVAASIDGSTDGREHGARTIRHEFLHELLFENLGTMNGHPVEYFGGRDDQGRYVAGKCSRIIA